MSASTTPISTYKTFLMKKGNSDYAKLVDIKEYPDLFGEPESLDVTTLSDGARKYIPGIKEQDPLKFVCNYLKTDFDTLAALEGTEYEFAVWFGASVSGGVATPTGDDGKYEFKGYLTVSINGGGVNEPVDMTITIMPTTVIAPAAA